MVKIRQQVYWLLGFFCFCFVLFYFNILLFSARKKNWKYMCDIRNLEFKLLFLIPIQIFQGCFLTTFFVHMFFFWKRETSASQQYQCIWFLLNFTIHIKLLQNCYFISLCKPTHKKRVGDLSFSRVPRKLNQVLLDLQYTVKILCSKVTLAHEILFHLFIFIFSHSYFPTCFMIYCFF